MRFLTTDQKALIRAPNIKGNVLATFWFDEGPFRCCDDIMDLTDGTDVWIGANALVSATSIRAGSPLSAEPVTLTVDGSRLYEAGVEDPAYILRAIFTTNFHQRRVDLAFAFSYIESPLVQLVIPAYAGKINYARLVDDSMELGGSDPGNAKLEIVLDALAARYRRRAYRTRSHDDQLQLTGGADMFYSFVAGAIGTEQTLYWGKAQPSGVTVGQRNTPSGGFIGAPPGGYGPI